MKTGVELQSVIPACAHWVRRQRQKMAGFHLEFAVQEAARLASQKHGRSSKPRQTNDENGGIVPQSLHRARDQVCGFGVLSLATPRMPGRLCVLHLSNPFDQVCRHSNRDPSPCCAGAMKAEASLCADVFDRPAPCHSKGISWIAVSKAMAKFHLLG